MRKSTLTRLIAVFLSLTTFASVFCLTVSADEDESSTIGYDISDVIDLINAISYVDYSKQNADVPKGKSEIVIDPVNDLNKEESDSAYQIVNDYNGLAGKALLTPDAGKTAWNVSVPADGRYTVAIEYSFPADGKTTNIERKFRIDGQFPFKGSRYLSITKVWHDEFVETDGVIGFAQDINGNDIKANKKIVPEARTYVFCDSTGYDIDAYEYVFTKGDHVISLEGSREMMAIKSIKLVPAKEQKKYADLAKEWQSKGYAAPVADPIIIQAETPSATSDQTIYAVNDRTSALTQPQSPSKSKLNAIGGTKWQSVGQWIEYTFECKASGLYQITPRFKQSDLSGMYVSRRIRINGEIPFAEASYLQFNYKDDWQTAVLNDGEQDFSFYFEEGKTYTIQFEVDLGNMSTIIGRVQDTLTSINNDYLKILQITGADPDEDRDYNFGKLIPDVLRDMYNQQAALYEIAGQIKEINGAAGSNTATLENVARVLYKMSTDQDVVAENMSALKSYIGTLGTWLNTVRSQPLAFDYLEIAPAGSPLPRANANFFQSVGYEFSSFFLSFVTDYSNLGATVKLDEKDMIEVWIPTGRDQANVVRSLIDNNFTGSTNIGVKLKLITLGTLLPSTLAGVGPDVALSNAQDIAVQYAIRSAVLPLEGFDTFNEVKSRFSESAIVPLSLADKDGVYHTYGLPETQTFPMLFYRKDILAELGVDIPRTWDDLMAIVPILQYNHMEVGMVKELGGLELFMYQRGGQLYTDKGMRVNLDSNIALNSFEELCSYFTQYSFPVYYDFANRFRSGEIPIGVQDYISMYNQLSVFATEIKDLWEFVPVIGYENEDGDINNISISTVTSLIMMAGSKEEKRENAWKFMDWFTTAETQSNYANEMIAIVGQGAMYATANIEALEALPWTSTELSNIQSQYHNLATIEELPGGYIIPRYVQFAFLNVVNNGDDPVESLLSYVDTINKEITRKRTEFNLPVLQLGETLADKEAQAAE